MAKAKKAKQNRTLSLTTDEQLFFSRRLSHFDKKANIRLEDLTDTTIYHDLFDIMDYLPKQFADLIIIDPPYNLTKNFHGYTFKSSSTEQYLNYLRSWFPTIV